MSLELLKTPSIAPELFLSEIEIVAEAFELRNAAITASESITSVDDQFDASTAARAMKALTDLRKEIESSRKLAKDPALQLGKRIDGVAKEFIESVLSEEGRLSKILGAYQIRQREIQREAEREAHKKEQAIIAEAQEKERKRLAEENKGRTGTLLEDIEDIAEEAKDKVIAVKQAAACSHGAVSGIKVRKSIKFEIEDEDELLKSRPDLFSPDEKKIRAALKISKTKPIAGLRIWEEEKAY